MGTASLLLPHLVEKLFFYTNLYLASTATEAHLLSPMVNELIMSKANYNGIFNKKSFRLAEIKSTPLYRNVIVLQKPKLPCTCKEGTESHVFPCRSRPLCFFARFVPSAPQPPHCLKKKAARPPSHWRLTFSTHSWRIAMGTAGGYLATTHSRIPGLLGPFYGCLGAHGCTLSRISTSYSGLSALQNRSSTASKLICRCLKHRFVQFPGIFVRDKLPGNRLFVPRFIM